jgi:hypothetical protein
MCGWRAAADVREGLSDGSKGLTSVGGLNGRGGRDNPSRKVRTPKGEGGG